MADLIENFSECVQTYDDRTPFNRARQVQTHLGTIARLRELGGPEAAIHDAQFVQMLRDTLKSWGIGARGSRLIPEPRFSAGLKERAREIQSLYRLKIDDITLETEDLLGLVWRLIRDLPIVENKAKIVAGSKTLHHLLPDLVVPIDGRWTGAFFGWPVAYLTYRQEATFIETFGRYIEVARVVDPAAYVGKRWRTSRSKVLDNAVIGYCKLRGVRPKN